MRGLFVEMGGKEEKPVVPPPKAGFAFVDAAFPENQALGSVAKRGADEGPFFKTNSRQSRGHDKGKQAKDGSGKSPYLPDNGRN